MLTKIKKTKQIEMKLNFLFLDKRFQKFILHLLDFLSFFNEKF